jgi:isoamylase
VASITRVTIACRPANLACYENFSGCGNTLNVAQPRVLQLLMDALRYWVEVMHVDGFRFDLAAALTRESAFLAAVAQDPVLQRVKLIAEPWDIGPDGYRLGRFLPALERME